MDAADAALPVVALSAAGSGAAFDTALRDASHASGFFYLTDHGIDPALTAELLAVSRRFFALPQAEKDALAMLGSPHFRGYTRLGGELTRGRQDWREQIDVAAERAAVASPAADRPWDVLEGPNLWPAALPELRSVLARWQQACTAVAGRLLHAWARALGQQETVFDAAFVDKPMTLLKAGALPGTRAGGGRLRPGCRCAQGPRRAHVAVAAGGHHRPAGAAR